MKDLRDLAFGWLRKAESDLWIAATALHYGLIVVSADQDFERIRQVQDFPLESWL